MVESLNHVWYFEDGATKHITSYKDLLTSLEAILDGNTITCATNRASSSFQEVGTIVLVATNGSPFTLLDTLYMYLELKKLCFQYFPLQNLRL